MVARYEDALAVIGALDARQLQQIRPGRPRRELAVLGRNAEAEATRKRTGLHFRRPQLRVKETVMLWACGTMIPHRFDTIDVGGGLLVKTVFPNS
jgi:hypothetical protein